MSNNSRTIDPESVDEPILNVEEQSELVRGKISPASEADSSSSPEGNDAKQICQFPRNDAGVAEAFADRNNGRVRFSPGIGWLIWNQSRWERDTSGRVTQLAISLSRQAQTEAAQLDGDARYAATKHALRIGDRARISAILELAESHPELHIPPSQLDSDPLIVGCLNGVIELQAGRFRPGNPNDLVTRSLGTRWEAGATCPLWDRFLLDVTKGDAELVDFLRRSVGYTMSGVMSEQCFWFLFGSGANGKSVFCKVLEKLLGEYAHRASAELFEKRHDRRKDPELAEIHSKRLILASETQEGGRLDERLVKDLSGGESVRGEAKYQAGIRFNPNAKIWLSGNHKPGITGSDLGIWRRVRLVPFEAHFQGSACDLTLAEKLLNELPGILCWAIRGFQEWQRDGLGFPERVRLAVADYQSDEDLLGQFIAERIEVGGSGSVTKVDVFHAYDSWCDEQGIRHRLTCGQLTRRLKERGWREHNKGWRGIRLAGEEFRNS